MGIVHVCAYARQWKAVPSVGDFIVLHFKKIKQISIFFSINTNERTGFWLAEAASPDSVSRIGAVVRRLAGKCAL